MSQVELCRRSSTEGVGLESPSFDPHTSQQPPTCISGQNVVARREMVFETNRTLSSFTPPRLRATAASDTRLPPTKTQASPKPTPSMQTGPTPMPSFTNRRLGKTRAVRSSSLYAAATAETAASANAASPPPTPVSTAAAAAAAAAAAWRSETILA